MREDGVKTMLWIRTVSGRRFFPFEPKPDDVDVHDIAHALSLLCCFAGQVPVFYSLAQHCVHVSELLIPRLRVYGLLVRADAAYLGSVPSMIRSGCPDLQRRSREIKGAIYRALRIQPPQGQDDGMIEYARDVVLATEARDIMGVEDAALQTTRPRTTKIEPVPAEEARGLWLRLLHEYLEEVAT